MIFQDDRERGNQAELWKIIHVTEIATQYQG